MDAADVAILRGLYWNPEDAHHAPEGPMAPWDVARALDLHRTTVMRRLELLAEQGVYLGSFLVRAPALNGTTAALYSFRFGDATAQAAASERLRAHPGVHEITEFLGDETWVPLVLAQGEDVDATAKSLGADVGASSVERVSTWDWPELAGPVSELDRRVLDALESDPHAKSADVAAAVGVTPKTIRLRLKALVKARAFAVFPGVALARITGLLAAVLLVEWPARPEPAAHARLVRELPEAFQWGGPREERTWVYVAVPDSASLEACAARARAAAGGARVRVLLVKRLVDR